MHGTIFRHRHRHGRRQKTRHTHTQHEGFTRSSRATDNGPRGKHTPSPSALALLEPREPQLAPSAPPSGRCLASCRSPFCRLAPRRPPSGLLLLTRPTLHQSLQHHYHHQFPPAHPYTITITTSILHPPSSISTVLCYHPSARVSPTSIDQSNRLCLDPTRHALPDNKTPAVRNHQPAAPPVSASRHLVSLSIRPGGQSLWSIFWSGTELRGACAPCLIPHSGDREPRLRRSRCLTTFGASSTSILQLLFINYTSPSSSASLTPNTIRTTLATTHLSLSWSD